MAKQASLSSISSAVPIIQIRNDRYRNPAQDPATYHQPADPYSQQPASASSSSYAPDPYTELLQEHQSLQNYNQQLQARESGLTYSPQLTSSSRGYHDWDNPSPDPAVASTAKAYGSNLKTIEAAGMRPVAAQRAAPPGAATLSQTARPLAAKSVSQNGAVRISTSGLKRKPAAVPDMSGPLRLGKGGGPGIDLDPSPNKKSKPAMVQEVIDLVRLRWSLDCL